MIVKNLNAALNSIFTPKFLIPLLVLIALWWYIAPGSYRLVREGVIGQTTVEALQADMAAQAKGFCAEKGTGYRFESSNTTLFDGVQVRAEMYFRCE